MRKKQLCDVRIPFKLELRGPTLIKSGAEQATGPDMTFVRSRRPGAEGASQVFLPGTSLKGVIRSHCERIARTLAQSGAGACAPHEKGDGPLKACGERLKKQTDKASFYRDACLACRLFGALGYGGRVSITDAYPVEGEPVVTEVRDGVAIDRYTGGAARGAKFQFEAATSGVFEGQITLENFETWQVGLLGAALRDLQDEHLPIGMGTSRGLGHVRGVFGDVELRYLTRQAPEEFGGIEGLVTDEESQRFGLFPGLGGSRLQLDGLERHGAFWKKRVPWSEFGGMLDAAAQHLADVLARDPWPESREGLAR